MKTRNSSAWYFVTAFVIGTGHSSDLSPLDYWFRGAMHRLISDIVEVISCNIMYLSQVIHLSCFYRPPNEKIRDFIDFFNNKIFPQIDEFVNSLSGQGYFPLILKPTRLSPENPETKYSLLD